MQLCASGPTRLTVLYDYTALQCPGLLSKPHALPPKPPQPPAEYSSLYVQQHICTSLVVLSDFQHQAASIKLHHRTALHCPRLSSKPHRPPNSLHQHRVLGCVALHPSANCTVSLYHCFTAMHRLGLFSKPRQPPPKPPPPTCLSPAGTSFTLGAANAG